LGRNRAGTLHQRVEGSVLSRTFRAVSIPATGRLAGSRRPSWTKTEACGIQFFEKLDRDIALHLAEVKAYKSGMVELRYEVQGDRGE
jgi:hypothetical protein